MSHSHILVFHRHGAKCGMVPFSDRMGKALHSLEADDADEIDNDSSELYD